MDYESGLINTISDVHIIEDRETDYMLFDKHRNNIGIYRKDRYYCVIKTE